MRLLYLLLIWNSHVLDQLVLARASVSPRSFIALGEVKQDVELVRQSVTASSKGPERIGLLDPPRPLERDGLGSSDARLDLSRSLKRRPTFKELLQKEKMEAAERDEIEKETLAIEKLYRHVIHPPDHLPAEMYEPFTPRKRVVPKKLKLKQIDQLKANDLINYISNFNAKVRLSREKWKEAERAEKAAEDLLYHKVAHFFLNTIKTEDREGALKNKLQELRTFTKKGVSNRLTDKELDQKTLRNFVNDQGWPIKTVELAHRHTQDLKQDAFLLARRYVSSGMKFLDQIKYSMRKFFNFKFKFKWPWKKSA